MIRACLGQVVGLLLELLMELAGERVEYLGSASLYHSLSTTTANSVKHYQFTRFGMLMCLCVL